MTCVRVGWYLSRGHDLRGAGLGIGVLVCRSSWLWGRYGGNGMNPGVEDLHTLTAIGTRCEESLHYRFIRVSLH